MKIGFKKKEKFTAGLDIGTRCVKLVCLEPGADEDRLQYYGMEELHADAILAGEVRDRDGVIRAVQSLTERSGLPIREVVVSLSGNEVLSEIVNIESVFEGKPNDAVRAEAERVNPFDFDVGSVTLDYKTLETDPESDQLKVLRIAARNEVIYNKYMDILSGARLRPLILDVDFCALVNVFSLNYDAKSFHTVALLNIGVESTSIVFLGNGVFYLTRELPIGVEAFVKEIQREQKVKVEEAERVLREAMESDSEEASLVDAIERVGQDLAKEIEIARSFFLSATSYESLDAMFVSGGGATIPGLTDLLGRLAGTSAKILNPLTAIKYDYSLFGDQSPEKVSPILALAIGLALRRD